MTHPISNLGIIHTLISLVPLIAGIYCFIRYRKIDPSTRAGKIYLVSLILTVLTSFGISKTGGFHAGHALGIIVLISALGGFFVFKLNFLGRLRPYLSAFGLSFSFLLSLIPGTNETLTRLPPSHPIAEGITSPIVLQTLLVWLILFVIGYVIQCRLIYIEHKNKLD